MTHTALFLSQMPDVIPETSIMVPNHRLPRDADSNRSSLLRDAFRLLAPLLFTIFAIAAYFSALASSHYVSPHINPLVIASALYFSLLCLISIIKHSYYWAALPLVILSVPNAINDLFPSMHMGPAVLNTEPPAFALFTHIDLFLLLGLVRYGRFNLSRQLLTAAFVAFLTAYFVVTSYLSGTWSTNGIYGLFQVRYAILIYFIFREVRFDNAKEPFTLGLISAIVLTLMEATVLSLILTPGHLISGNFGKNPLGHLGAATLCFFIFYRAPKATLLRKYLPLGIATLLMLGSGTRFSIVAAMTSVFLVHSLRSSSLIKNVTYTLVGTLGFLTLLLVTPQGKSIFDGIAHISEGINVPDMLERTPESSSMITRLETWLHTYEMINKYWMTGIGPGNWSFLKGNFHIPYEGLLDPHNDVLNFVVSYGLPFGLLFYAAIFIYPLITGYRFSLKYHDDFLQGCYAFILCIAITGLTNATLWKHSVFGITCVFACIFISHRLDQKNGK